MTATIQANRVLPTLNDDGTRRWIRPRLFKGRFYKARLAVGWSLIALFVTLPFLKIGGKPLVLLDIARREFTLFGRTFLPTDGVLLMLLLLAIFVAIIGLTAVVGRAWCGWACPQTVYMEFVFRPLERLFDGAFFGKLPKAAKPSPARTALKYAVFAVTAFALGNVFLAYFVGVDRLSHWMLSSPAEHPTGFLVMATTAGLVFADFAWFREQMCTVVCPYARLQSVLLDSKSLVVAYDARRGEPRGKRGKTIGDCVDCGACVTACPTGIDIRNGLQLECIACAQCIDACEGVMTKLGRKRDLIRYTSEDALKKGRLDKRGLLRARTIAYPALFIVLVGALFVATPFDRVADVTLLRGIGAPFVEQGERIQNLVRVKIRNRGSEPNTFSVSLLDAPGAELIAPENPIRLAAGAQASQTVFVLVPRNVFVRGSLSVRFRVTDGAAFEKTLPYKLVGPEQRP